ncbi:MAG: thioredoxin domain-containing protein [Patulibacter sp.]|nr:thioredoxin domain-containing protein [Patulibacter sp.]
MANKAEQKNQARLKREQAQAAAAAAAKRNRNLQIGGGIIGLAVLVVIIGVIASGGDSSKKNKGLGADKNAAVAGVTETNTLLKGIPQSGYVLGNAKAPITILEFLDVQCPYCKAHELDEQPTVIKQLVRTGKAALKMEPVGILGQDSEDGRVVLTRVAAENKAWNFVNLFYWNQGTERTGYVTDDFLRKISVAAGAKATDISRTPDAAIKAKLATADKLASTLNVTGTPTFAVGLTKNAEDTYKQVDLSNAQGGNASAIISAVEALEKSAGV